MFHLRVAAGGRFQRNIWPLPERSKYVHEAKGDERHSQSEETEDEQVPNDTQKHPEYSEQELVQAKTTDQLEEIEKKKFDENVIAVTETCKAISGVIRR